MERLYIFPAVCAGTCFKRRLHMPVSALLLANFAREVFTDVLIALFYSGFGQYILGVQQRPRRIALACAINAASHFLSRHLLFTTFFSYLLTAADLFVICRLLWYPRRGSSFWAPFIFCTVMMILNEIIITSIYILIYPDAGTSLDVAGVPLYALEPYTYPVLFLLTTLYLLAILLLFCWSRRLIRYLRARRVNVLHVLRFSAAMVLLFIVLAMFGLDFDRLLWDHMDTALQDSAFREKLYAYAVYFGLSILLGAYIWQDIRQFVLRRANLSLNEKNVAYQRVIESTREYRHNMANLLYGLEGVILTQDIAQINAYYADMAHRCARINNENATAVNRLSVPALAALLLRKMDNAEKKGVPFYLSVSEGFSFNAFPTTALCEVLGNLIDNALEAAACSCSPRVDLTLRSADGYDEIIISNTYAEGADLRFLSEAPHSSKPGHQATGLESVRKIVRKSRSVCFNQFVRGRYIESSLCAYKH